jgi:hypothetical protein
MIPRWLWDHDPTWLWDHDPTAIVSRLHRRNLKTSTCAVTDDGDDDGCGIMIAGSAGGGVGVCVRHLRFAEDLASSLFRRGRFNFL